MAALNASNLARGLSIREPVRMTVRETKPTQRDNRNFRFFKIQSFGVNGRLVSELAAG
jgi:hypothetical protein